LPKTTTLLATIFRFIYFIAIYHTLYSYHIYIIIMTVTIGKPGVCGLGHVGDDDDSRMLLCDRVGFVPVGAEWCHSTE
jgi:hypothetical protein